MSSQTFTAKLDLPPGASTTFVRPIPAPPSRHLSTLQIGLGSNGVVAGGAERVFAELSERLPEHGIEFCGAVVFQAAQGGALKTFPHVFAPAGAGLGTRLIGARKLLCGLINGGSFDLVASHFALYSLPALDAIRKKPFVVHFHGPWSAESLEEGSGRLAALTKQKLETLVYREANRMIVLSKAFAELLEREYGVKRDRIRVVPGCVDVDRFNLAISRAEARIQLGLPRDRPILISVRRLTHRVGLDLLLAAMPDIIARYPDVLLCIGGKGSLRGKLELQVSELGLQHHVRFLGFVSEEDLPVAYRAADFNVVPSRAWEGFGLVAAEGLAAGTPTLVTPVGGLPEIIGPLSPGLIFESTSPPAIADGVCNALSGRTFVPDERACKDYAASTLSSSLMARRTAGVYREAVDC